MKTILKVTYEAAVPTTYTPPESFLAIVPSKDSGLKVFRGYAELVTWSSAACQYSNRGYHSEKMLTVEELRDCLKAYEERNL